MEYPQSLLAVQSHFVPPLAEFALCHEVNDSILSPIFFLKYQGLN